MHQQFTSEMHNALVTMGLRDGRLWYQSWYVYVYNVQYVHH